MIMQSYLTKWSLTRRKIFVNCARRFAINYFHQPKDYNNKFRKSKPSSNWDLMIYSARKVFFERLADLHKGITWGDKLTDSRIHFEIISNYASKQPNSKLSIEEKHQLISQAKNRIKRLMNQQVIRKICQGKILEWSCHDRIEPTFFGHLEVYCSPDLVFRLDGKWHLVRFNFQAELNQPYLKLELCTMLLWSKGNQYMPKLEEKFIIHGLSFHNGKWDYRIIKPTQTDLQETKQLLEKDVHNMNLLQLEFYRYQDYDKLSLARSNLYCRRCPYKNNCPINN